MRKLAIGLILSLAFAFTGAAWALCPCEETTPPSCTFDPLDPCLEAYLFDQWGVPHEGEIDGSFASRLPNGVRVPMLFRTINTKTREVVKWKVYMVDKREEPEGGTGVIEMGIGDCGDSCGCSACAGTCAALPVQCPDGNMDYIMSSCYLVDLFPWLGENCFCSTCNCGPECATSPSGCSSCFWCACHCIASGIICTGDPFPPFAGGGDGCGETTPCSELMPCPWGDDDDMPDCANDWDDCPLCDCDSCGE